GSRGPPRARAGGERRAHRRAGSRVRPRAAGLPVLARLLGRAGFGQRRWWIFHPAGRRGPAAASSGRRCGAVRPRPPRRGGGGAGRGGVGVPSPVRFAVRNGIRYIVCYAVTYTVTLLLRPPLPHPVPCFLLLPPHLLGGRLVVPEVVDHPTVHTGRWASGVVAPVTSLVPQSRLDQLAGPRRAGTPGRQRQVGPADHPVGLHGRAPLDGLPPEPIGGVVQVADLGVVGDPVVVADPCHAAAFLLRVPLARAVALMSACRRIALRSS